MTATRLPDDYDLQIIACFRRDPRMTNKAIAHTVGLAEPTVASRIRAMTEHNIMRVMAQRDLAAAGYAVLAFLDIYPGAATVDEVARGVAGIDEAFSVTISPGSPEIIANVNAHSLDHLQQILTGPLARVSGIERADLSICLSVAKYVSGAGDLSHGFTAPDSASMQSDTDERMIEMLVADGRLSNREIARRLEISEGSVRQRLKRLEDANIIRLGIVCEPGKVGYQYSAYLLARVEPHATAAVLEALTAMEEVSFAGLTTGAYNVWALVIAADPERIPNLSNVDLRAMGGVRAVSVRPLTRAEKHRYDYLRITARSPQVLLAVE